MTPEAFGASAISFALSKDEAIVRNIATSLPLESSSRRGSRRNFTIGDSVAILLVDDLCGAGIAKRAAFAIGAALCDHFVRVVAEETHRPWLVVWPDKASALGLSWTIQVDATAALAVLRLHPLATTMNVYDAVHGALARLLEATRAEKVGGCDA